MDYFKFNISPQRRAYLILEGLLVSLSLGGEGETGMSCIRDVNENNVNINHAVWK